MKEKIKFKLDNLFCRTRSPVFLGLVGGFAESRSYDKMHLRAFALFVLVLSPWLLGAMFVAVYYLLSFKIKETYSEEFYNEAHEE